MNSVEGPAGEVAMQGLGPPTSSFEKLQKRAFGGEDVAARPGPEDDEWWPRAPLLPGVEALLDDFTGGVGNEDLRISFLLGGAGNGKSFAARLLGTKLGLVFREDDPLARRIYETHRPGASIELLNDATIAPSAEYESSQGHALASDIERWWAGLAERGVAAFCCVNRGIVIDELRSLSDIGGDIGPVPRAILAWLASPDLDVPAKLGATPGQPKLDLGDHYREICFELEGRSVRISALSVDACSLLAPVEGRSRAGKLFQGVLQRCHEEALERPAECPLRANVEQWSRENAILAWETALEHAEIASGRMHSYRDIWGLAALSILGPRFSTTGDSSSLLQHIDLRLAAARNGSSSAHRLQAWLDLSHFRAHNALFRAPIPRGGDAVPHYPPTTPPHLGFSLVDPSIWNSSKSRTIEEAMHGIALGELPSAALHATADLVGAWSTFDSCLEQALVEFVGTDACPDVVRRRLVSWYGGYLMRLVGVSSCHLGNHAAIALWKQLRSLSNKNGALPLEFGKAIRSLIFPQHEDAPRDSILVPAFAAKVEPVRTHEEGTAPRLLEVVPHGSINLQLRQRGGRLMLECSLAGEAEVIGELVLDFQLVRETLACRDQRAGQTESSAHVDPRIERCRASSLAKVPGNQRLLGVMSGGQLMELH